MVREVLTVSIGQCGIQTGLQLWALYCKEHSINPDGSRSIKDNDKSFQTFFDETGLGNYVPRSINIDLEPNVIDDLKNSKYSSLFYDEFLINGKEDAANIFARGHYTVGKEIIYKFNDRIRKLVDNCDNVQGFMFNHSISGGTGSGLGALILERIAVDYRKKTKMGFEVFPSDLLSTSVVEPYNSLLSIHWLLDHTEVSLLFDNEAMYNICQKNLDIKKPSYNNLNRLISKVCSSMTASLRFEGELNVDLNEFQTSLVPFPRLNFYTTGISPIISIYKTHTYPDDLYAITAAAFDPNNFMIKLPDFDAEFDKYMAVSLNYRGNVYSKEANGCVQRIKQEKKAVFVEWCPTGFKIGLNEMACPVTDEDDMAFISKNATMIGNNTAISRVFANRISRKYDLLYSQRAFVHWFVAEGMEEGEFAEAREDLGFLEKDYLDVLTEQATDDYDEEDGLDDSFDDDF